MGPIGPGKKGEDQVPVGNRAGHLEVEGLSSAPSTLCPVKVLKVYTEPYTMSANEAKEDKKRELLPDIVNRQGIMREQLGRLEVQLAAFDSSWASQRTLDPEEQKKDAENMSVVDEIYAGMRRETDRLEAIITHLDKIRANYLGDI